MTARMHFRVTFLFAHKTSLRHDRPLVAPAFIACIATLIWGVSAEADLTVDTDQNRERLTTYVGMYNELADRRRKVIYTEHPVSARNGVLHEFVHVSDGTAAFARTDLVVDAPMPIVVRRAYHSGRTQSRTFGATGWHLTIDESVVRQPGGGYLYRYGNGSTVAFTRRGRFVEELDAFLSEVSEFDRSQGNVITVRTRTGLTKLFQKTGNDFRLIKVQDASGNTQQFHYDGKRLTAVTADESASIMLHYDAALRLAAIKDSTGREVTYSYGADGRLTAVRDIRGQTWTFEYSADGKLFKSNTPNGIADLEFSYDALGRVDTLARNGVASRYRYEDDSTIVEDSMGRLTRFVADTRGLTRSVVNAAGSETTVRFNPSGLPGSILRNGDVVADFEYHDNESGTPSAISILTKGSTYQLAADEQGRIVSVKANGNSRDSYTVEYASGLAPATITLASGDVRNVKYDAGGHVSYYSPAAHEVVLLLRSERTLRLHKKGSGGATLSFNTFGQLALVEPMSGDSAQFDYDSSGFRQSTATSAGERVDYVYDATGNLLSTTLTGTAGDTERFVYGLSPHNRLEFISSGKPQNDATFEYDDFGLPLKTSSTDIIGLTFAHDAVGRLTSIQPDGAERLDYTYGPGEPDIARQLDDVTSRVHLQQKERSPFAGREAVFLHRVEPSGYGYLTYDQSVQELAPLVDPQRWSPDRHIQNMLANMKIDYLLADGGPQYAEFTKPSNRFFIPPELWAINCCFCCSNDELACEIP